MEYYIRWPADSVESRGSVVGWSDPQAKKQFYECRSWRDTKYEQR